MSCRRTSWSRSSALAVETSQRAQSIQLSPFFTFNPPPRQHTVFIKHGNETQTSPFSPNRRPPRQSVHPLPLVSEAPPPLLLTLPSARIQTRSLLHSIHHRSSSSSTLPHLSFQSSPPFFHFHPQPSPRVHLISSETLRPAFYL